MIYSWIKVGDLTPFSDLISVDFFLTLLIRVDAGGVVLFIVCNNILMSSRTLLKQLSSILQTIRNTPTEQTDTLHEV